jgi:Predicted Zn-dependent proteases and their inactivated homologs
LPKDLEELDNFVKKEDVSFRSLYVSMGRSKTYLVNSEGTRIRSNLPGLSGFFSIIVGKGNASRQRTILFGKTGGYELFKIEVLENKLEKEIKALHNVVENGKSISNYELSKIKNVVASPEIVGIAVHESIGHPSEADRVFGREAAQAGLSYLNSSNLGIKIGSEKVNIVDNPTIKNSYGFFLYDDEGVKARPKILVKEGIQNELLLNREYAYLMGKSSNGSARSDSYSNEPIIRMSNTYLEKGDANIKELFSEAKNGIYIKSFTEWNIDDTRSFARYQGNEAYLIKNGEPTVPIKNYKLDSSTFDFWNAVSLLGNDFELYPGNCGKGEPMQGVSVMMGGPFCAFKIQLRKWMRARYLN